MKFPGRRTVRKLTRQDLHDEIRKTQEQLIQLLEEYVPMKEWGNRKVFIPLVDVKEERDNLIVTTDLPGVTCSPGVRLRSTTRPSIVATKSRSDKADSAASNALSAVARRTSAVAIRLSARSTASGSGPSRYIS